eukprot:TRINITY_DN17530_c0_g1_i1.p1 TRINITY_DN17530_c0_g1~~TRINITY_DN17530_c0_g1_i1.p1  ORF type:complete len:258 (+),score=20.00 TRINITY_DN17530_c0_g1_i1:138-911(+)
MSELGDSSAAPGSETADDRLVWTRALADNGLIERLYLQSTDIRRMNLKLAEKKHYPREKEPKILTSDMKATLEERLYTQSLKTLKQRKQKSDEDAEIRVAKLRRNAPSTLKRPLSQKEEEGIERLYSGPIMLMKKKHEVALKKHTPDYLVGRSNPKSPFYAPPVKERVLRTVVDRLTQEAPAWSAAERARLDAETYREAPREWRAPEELEAAARRLAIEDSEERREYRAAAERAALWKPAGASALLQKIHSAPGGRR